MERQLCHDEIEDIFRNRLITLPGMGIREGQIEMAHAVSSCITSATKQHLVIEAGTGTGKGNAYLVPAIISPFNTIVSTKTIALQTQLITKDLPGLEKILGPFTYTLMKGRNNFVCLNKLDTTSDEWKEKNKEFMNWMKEDGTGDKERLTIPMHDWDMVCSDSDDCYYELCELIDECPYMRHKDQAGASKVLVINHHLLALGMKSEKLLPPHDILIVDEAHKLGEVFTEVFGDKLSYGHISRMIKKLISAKIDINVDLKFTYKFFHTYIGAKTGPIYDTGLLEVAREIDFKDILYKINKRIDRLRALKQEGRVLQEKMRYTNLHRIVNDMHALITLLANPANRNANKVYYTQWNNGGKESKIYVKPLSCDMYVKDLSETYQNIVFTSATLSTQGNFDYFRYELGLGKMTGPVNYHIIESPFDYQEQCICYVASDLPEPKKHDYLKEATKRAGELINCSRGGALILCTSYDQLYYLKANLDRHSLACKLQGDMSNTELLEWLRGNPNGVIIGVGTFWEGIDVKGDNLRMLIIMRIPFTCPDDPVFDAKKKLMRRMHGSRWFDLLAVPQAAIMLKQGYGRLIRDVTDRGVVAILDKRIITSTRYSEALLGSLPGGKLTDKLEELEKWKHLKIISFKNS